MPEYVIGALIGVGGTILGVIISYYYSFGLVKKTEFIKACVEFKLSFSEIIQWINETSVNNSDSIFGKLRVPDIAQRHEGAICRFRTYLNTAKQIEFDKACIKFYNEKNGHRYEGYVILNSPSPRKDERNLALRNINELLEFAEY